MFVHRAENRPDRVPVAARVTRVSLADLLIGSGADKREQRDLTELLQRLGTLSARVVEARPDGTHLLDLNGKRFTLALASQHTVGEVLIIEMNETDAAQRPAVVALSGSAKLIQNLLDSANKPMITENATAQPIADSAESPQALALALRQAIRTSGLFYESHLQAWAEGRFPLSEIVKEPQALLQATFALDNDATGTMHPRLAALVQQQLDTFARQAIHWRGALWPDQPAELEITSERSSDNEHARIWNVRINLDLPQLGAVSVGISLATPALARRPTFPSSGRCATRWAGG